MNKSQLIKAIAEKADISVAAATRALGAMTETITEQLAAQESVILVGFGIFDVRDRTARVGRNPKTGESIQIPASKNPAFKAGKALKEAVNSP